jgi:hypothetical protein
MEDRGFSDVFADGVSVAGGPFGISLTFMLSDPARQRQLEAMRTIARIRLSPALARALVEALTQATTAPGAPAAMKE